MQRNKQKPYIILILFLAATLLVFSNSVGAKVFPSSDELPNFTSLAKHAKESVVNIQTVKTIKGGGQVFQQFYGGQGKSPFEDFFAPFFDDPRFREHKQQSLGSGFIIDRDGYIVTNNHVVEGADQIMVKLSDGREFEAEVKGTDTNTDLALIKIKNAKDLVPLKLGDSEKLEVGEWVVAIGSPFGLEQTVTKGIVSAKGRVIGSGPYDDFIQTDASINPGNSGGPLLNMDGEVIGINAAIVASGQGIGFAIPTNLAKGVIDQLKDAGEVTRGWLGVVIQDVSEEMADYYGIKDKKGALVVDVVQGDPAEKAGLQPQDVIIYVDGTKVESSRDLTRKVADLPVGKQVDITAVRSGKEKHFTVTLGKRDDKKELASSREDTGKDHIGITVTELNDELRRRLEIDKDEKGVIVTRVAPESKAAEAGVENGDLIFEVNHQDIKSISDFERAVDKVDSGQMLNLLIKRGRYGIIVIKFIK